MPDIDYADLTDVQSRRGGDVPTVSDSWDDVITAKISEISRQLDRQVGRVRGSIGPFQIVASGTATTRSFYVPAGGTDILPIDDCVAVTSATRTPPLATTASALVAGTDYRLVRSRGVIVGLAALAARWEPNARIDVLACWGLMDAVSSDLRAVTIIEVIRSFMGDRAGNDDVVGLSPFGQVTFSKSDTAKTNRFVVDWTYGGASLRGN